MKAEKENLAHHDSIKGGSFLVITLCAILVGTLVTIALPISFVVKLFILFLLGPVSVVIGNIATS